MFACQKYESTNMKRDNLFLFYRGISFLIFKQADWSAYIPWSFEVTAQINKHIVLLGKVKST